MARIKGTFLGRNIEKKFSLRLERPRNTDPNQIEKEIEKVKLA